MPIKITFQITLDQLMNGLYYAFLVWLFIEPLGIGLFAMLLILVPLLFIGAAWQWFERSQRSKPLEIINYPEF